MIMPFGTDYKTKEREKLETIQHEVCEAFINWVMSDDSPFQQHPLVSRRLVVPVCLLFTRKPFKFQHLEKTMVTLDPSELSEIANLTGEIEFLEIFSCRIWNSHKTARILFAFDILKGGSHIDPSDLMLRKKVEFKYTEKGWEVTGYKN